MRPLYAPDMPLQTFEVTPVTGQVRYLTVGSTGFKMTVECPERRFALLVPGYGRPKAKVGSWVEVRGTVRMDPTLNKTTGEPNEKNLVYRHDPFDGTPRSQWLFFEMRDAEFVEVPPPAVTDALDYMARASRGLRVGAPDWVDPAAMKECLSKLGESYETVRRYYGQLVQELEPIRTVDLSL